MLLPDDDDRARHVAGLDARVRDADGAGAGRPRRCRRIAVGARPALIYLQIVVGATMRHTGAGLAIPDFPLVFGQLIPPHWDAKIAIHFAHRVGALVVSLA